MGNAGYLFIAIIPGMARWWAFVVCLWLWMSASQRIPLSALARNWQEGLAREISYETGRRPGKARSEIREQRGVNDSQGKATVREKQLLEEELGPVDLEAESVSTRGWVSVPGRWVKISLGYTLAIATEPQKHIHARKVLKTSPFLRLGPTQVRSCLFFFLLLSDIYDISVTYL